MSDQPEDDFDRDLHPNAGAGQNNERDTTETEKKRANRLRHQGNSRIARHHDRRQP